MNLALLAFPSCLQTLGQFQKGTGYVRKLAFLRCNIAFRFEVEFETRSSKVYLNLDLFLEYFKE